MFFQDHFPALPTRPDPKLATRLISVYNDELNRALAYTYQHLLTEELDCESSALFLSLAKREMDHVHTLGRLIRDLGGDPCVSLRLRTPRVELSEDAPGRILPAVKRMLRLDMQSVAQGITNLETFSAAAEGNEGAVTVLRKIIGEEQIHYEALLRQSEEIQQEEG